MFFCSYRRMSYLLLSLLALLSGELAQRLQVVKQTTQTGAKQNCRPCLFRFDQMPALALSWEHKL
ncbi:hypothetical protein D3C84_885300 [compost metagenome]